MAVPSSFLLTLLVFSCIILFIFPATIKSQKTGSTRHYRFDVQMTNVMRLCETKSIVTVNGQFPGPKLVAREGDRVIVRVVNHVPYNITLHWHGVRQLRSAWADGPAYVTQCPIQKDHTYVYNFTIVGQRGTLWWHAHISWLRSTVYGAIVILPKLSVPYPFAKPYKEVPIIFGEWWKADTEQVIRQALQTGGGPNVSDSYTINGLPGPLYNCSAKVGLGSLPSLQHHPVTVPIGPRPSSTPGWQRSANIPPRQNRSYIPSWQRRANIPPRQRRNYVSVMEGGPTALSYADRVQPQPSSEPELVIVDPPPQVLEIDDVIQGGGTPASEHALESLPSVIVSLDDDDANCVICFDKMCSHNDKDITKLPCNHLFHRHCIVHWLSSNNTCPICRFMLPTDGTTHPA